MWCHQCLTRVMMRDFRRTSLMKKYGRGNPVLIYINKKSEYAGFKNKYGRIKNYTWI